MQKKPIIKVVLGLIGIYAGWRLLEYVETFFRGTEAVLPQFHLEPIMLSLTGLGVIIAAGVLVVNSLLSIITERRSLITLEPSLGLITFSNLPIGKFSLNVKNVGDYIVYDTSIGMRIRSINYSALLLTQRSLAPTHGFVIGFALIDVPDPPRFRLFVEAHTSEEPPEVPEAPELQLAWGRKYLIEFEYSYQGSNKKKSYFELEMGSRDNRLLRLTEA